MGMIDQAWLFERGGLHDARIVAVRSDTEKLEIDIDDEWANERSLDKPYGEKDPIRLSFSKPVLIAGELLDNNGGWLVELVLENDGSFRFVFNDRGSVVIRAETAEYHDVDEA